MKLEKLHNNMVVIKLLFDCLIRNFICVGTMAAAFWNQTNLNGASGGNVIPAMVQSKVKVHKILFQPRDI